MSSSLIIVCLVASLISLCLMLFFVLHSQTTKVLAHTAPALCDLLDYATLATDNIIVLKSGALMSCFRIRLPDLNMLSSSEVDHIYAMTRCALLKLNGNYCIQADILRENTPHYYPFVEGSLPVLDDVEERRKALFLKEGCFSSELYLSITYIGESATTHTLENMLIDSEHDDRTAQYKTEQVLHSFAETCQKIIETIRSGLTVEALGSCQRVVPPLRSSCLHDNGRTTIQEHEGLTFLHKCLTGKSNSIALPAHKVYLDAVLSTEDFFHGLLPKIGKNYVCVLALDGFPEQVHAGLLNRLADLPFAYRFNSRFIYFDTMKSTMMLEKYRRYWAQKSKGILAQIFNVDNARVNEHAIEQMKEIDEAKKALDSNETSFGAYTATLIIMDEDKDRLQHKSIDAIKAIEDVGINVRVETINATEAFLGSLPGHFFENVRRPIVSQDVLLDLLPLSLPDSGETESPNPFYGEHASPLLQVRVAGQSSCCLNLHEQDLGNAIVIGPPGSGKSVLLGELMLNLLRYKGMRIFAFDKGYSFYALTKALHGKHITFDNSEALLCPLAHLESEVDFDYALNFLCTLVRLNAGEVNAEQKNEMIEILHLLREKPSNERSLSDFHLMLTDIGLKTALLPYLAQRCHTSLIDGRENLDLGGQITTFECAALFDATKAFALPVLKQVFHLIDKQRNGKPAAIILDEAWLMLQDPFFAEEVLTWFKTLRKFNVIVILATQSLTDLQDSEHFIALMECAKTRFYLPNYDALSPGIHEVYQKMGLNEKEIATIAHAQPKRDYLFVKNKRHVLFNLVLSPEELRLLSFAGDHQKKNVDELFTHYGDTFYAANI